MELTGRRARAVAAGAVVVAGVLTFVALRERRARHLMQLRAHELVMGAVVVDLDPKTGVITLRDTARSWSRELALAAVVDGQVESLGFGAAPPSVVGPTMQAPVRLEIDSVPVEAMFTLSMQRESGVLVALLRVPAQPTASPHDVALRVEVPTGGRSAFLAGVGEVSDLGASTGHLLLVDAERMTLGFISVRGSIEVSGVADEGEEPGMPMRLAIRGSFEKVLGDGAANVDLRMAVGTSPAPVASALYQLSGERTARVAGKVTGARAPARVFGLDAAGVPTIRVDTDDAGNFALSAPTTVSLWYAAVASALTSTPVRFVPGSGGELRLNIAPSGMLRIRVTDPDTQRPLTARIVVRGEGTTLDPSFGPDYRATGAGPLIDALRGEVDTPIPEGNYRVAATKGIEWSIDAKSVVVEPGHTIDVDLAPRHVIPSAGVVDCDLHVHARPSFDSPVTPEDRVLSLVAAGIGFAVPTEHNLVGDYGPSLATLDLSRQLSTVTGVEVTTYSPRFGHFGIFPYPKGPVPPYRSTTASQIFAAAHTDPTRVLQVNHPRLSKGIGYFDVFHFDPKAPRPPSGMRTDFDALEVYNGYDLAQPERVDAVMHDWFALLNEGYHYVATGSSDSHRIQYQWAGYPRTVVSLPAAASMDEDVGIDPLAVVSSLKKGHAFVTSGPMLDLDVEGAHPGDEALVRHGAVHLHIVVRAAPWIDVTSVDVIVAGRLAQTIPVPSRSTVIGPETGTLDDAQLRTIRVEETLAVDVGPSDGWILIVARGTRKLDDVLPFMPVPPLAFTNPVWLVDDPASFVGPPKPRRKPR